MTKILRRFLADDMRLLTEIGIREQNRVRVDGSKRGMMVYGPYIDLMPGHYEASVKFDPTVTPAGSATLDVRADAGPEVLAKRIIKAGQLRKQDFVISLPFHCKKFMREVEIRIFSRPDFVAAAHYIEIRGELPVDQDSFSFNIEDLPSVDVRNELCRGRNPYDGYQRGIGLITPSIAEKIMMDSDFQEAYDFAASRTIVTEDKLANIFLLIKYYSTRLPFGHIVEYGSFKGGSAVFMAALAQKFLPNAQVFAFDTFSGMPETDKAIDLHNIGDFREVDLNGLRKYVEQIGLQNLHFVQGRFEETAWPVLQEIQQVTLCHIDCDIRSAIEAAYEATRPYMIPGDYWVFDDPLQPTCLGATEAVEDLLVRRDGLNAEQVYPHLVFRQP